MNLLCSRCPRYSTYSMFQSGLGNLANSSGGIKLLGCSHLLRRSHSSVVRVCYIVIVLTWAFLPLFPHQSPLTDPPVPPSLRLSSPIRVIDWDKATSHRPLQRHRP